MTVPKCLTRCGHDHAILDGPVSARDLTMELDALIGTFLTDPKVCGT